MQYRKVIMPKIKTHKATAKRVKKRGSGSLKRRNMNATHLLGHKSTKRKRAFRKNESISSADSKKVLRALALK
jgi:large subunit ribosomal protein L35